MTESLRDLLLRSADLVDRPQLDVDLLVAEAERRLVRRRVGVVAASAAAVAVITVGGLALQATDESSAPPAPDPATESPDPSPQLGDAIYFDALAVKGDSLTDSIYRVDGQEDIYLVHEGGPARQIIATGSHEDCPRVSPDGEMLAYLEDRRTVVLRRLDSTGQPVAEAVRVRLNADQGVTCPQWSPDGQQLAVGVQGYETPDQFLEVRVIGRDGRDRLIATRRDTYQPLPDIAWASDGEEIAFTTPDSVWIAPLDGGEARMAWRGRAPQPPGGPPPPGTIREVSWLATGELAVNTLGRYTDVGQDEELHLVDPVSGREESLGTYSTDSTSWVWSPDGSRAVFSDTDGTVRLVDRSTGRTVPVEPRLKGKQIPIWGVVWSADGRRLVGTAADADPSTVVFALVSMEPDGSSVDVLTPWNMALYSTADVSWSAR